jgi:2-polyprenyl-6-methoxyphenol hydroxylase-like FAD-dependent oxidoreductase
LLAWRTDPRAAADLVVGADGIHSAVRRAVVGEVTPRYAGFATWVGIIDNGGLIAGQTATEYLGDGQRCGLLPLTANRMYYSFASASEQGIPKPAGGALTR